MSNFSEDSLVEQPAIVLFAELVLVVGGAVDGHRAEPHPEELAARARALMDGGTERKEALSQVARELGVPRRKVFDALLKPH